MKKLLVLMLVASLCALANGNMILQISAGGNPEPTDSSIVLVPSETIALDVYATLGHGYEGVDTYWGLVLSDATAGLGSIMGGLVHIPPAPDMSGMVQDMSEFFPGDGGVFGCIASSTGAATVDGVYFDEIIFHCELPGDAVVQLWSTPDAGATFVLEDTLIIHQIPEPATIALLCLGGLLLRKK